MERQALSFAVYQHPRYAHHLNAAMMLRSVNLLRHNSPQSSYIDLARYIMEGLTLEAFDAEDFLCRLLAVIKCEGNALPTHTHVQSIMALVWDSRIPDEHLEDMDAICTAVFDFLFEEFSDQFMMAMRSFAAAMKVKVDFDVMNSRAEGPQAPESSTDPEHKEQGEAKPLLPPHRLH